MEVVLTLALKPTTLKRVLIITYYWPPAGGVAVQRWVKMARYLRQFGWEPVIYTAENGEMPVIDESLAATLPAGLEVIKRPIWEPYSWYKRFLGLSKEEKINAAFLQEKKKTGLLQHLAIWVRGNLFIPDARRFWIKPSVRFLTDYVKSHPVDAIISTGPPHSMHLIAMGLKERTGIPWIADFRDPWTRIDYYHELHLTSFADKRHHQLEKQVATNADALVTVSMQWANDFNLLNNGNSTVITNGYDEDDFPAVHPDPEKGFVLHHVGMINKARNPEALWLAISNLCKTLPGFSDDLRIVFTGKNDYSVHEFLEKYGLTGYAENRGQVTHAEAINAMCSATILLLLINDAQDILGRIPAKLFEYIAAKRPILAIGDPKGDAATILEETGAGILIDLKDVDGLQSTIASWYADYKSGKLSVKSGGIEKYARKSVTEQYARLLDSLHRKAARI